ncbi:transposase [Chryseobacterium sp. JJR-5R]|uniref:transposase n=1 Tax=Chryseobacterium sp. JJR-5R TaxID=3093923 RepID=UPI002A7594F0|nr:transposase [Chryseobacterium sp. JJR-5R]WPO81943.1 transposase [Chryseobacterium sp. JJR-5R]
MKRERKTYDPAFETKAVHLSNERSNISELARELGIAVTLLYKWRKEYEEFGEGSFPGNVNLKLTPEQEKIHEPEITSFITTFSRVSSATFFLC